jgi:hypothetical protein
MLGKDAGERRSSKLWEKKKEKAKGYTQGLEFIWRRRRDSNPRYPDYGQNGFRDRRIQPLCHPSAGMGLVENQSRMVSVLRNLNNSGVRSERVFTLVLVC